MADQSTGTDKSQAQGSASAGADKRELLGKLRIDRAAPIRSEPSRWKLPAAIGLISRQAGTVEGTDYRGMPVMAAYRPVKGTDWLVVAKIDRKEAEALLRILERREFVLQSREFLREFHVGKFSSRARAITRFRLSGRTSPRWTGTARARAWPRRRAPD